MAEFRDATGRPGPATWELGTYPEGQENYPVAGISWYEAAAYAEYVGKSLPTLYHWAWVAGLRHAEFIVPLSNFGESGVAGMGLYILALENRIKTAVLVLGGYEPEKKDPPPVRNQLNYTPRVIIPVLMLNGRYDPFFPLEETVRPMFQHLGTPIELKKLIEFDGGHNIYRTHRNKLIKEVLDWLDRYLGPVK
jgi:pimeloyl-ACP methyl ester carboxylesterase